MMDRNSIAKRIKNKIYDSYYRSFDKRDRVIQYLKWWLQQKKDSNLSKVYFHGTKQEFFDQVKCYDIISFDIFDTLITRCVQKPVDIFSILGYWVEKTYHIKSEKFFDARIKAESDENRRLNENATLNDIYNVLRQKLGLNVEQCNLIKQKELTIESQYLIPRKEMVEVLKKLKLHGKKIWLISDMYLSKDTIKSFLEKCGINHSFYDEIYISSETQKRKDNSAIWREIAEKCKERKYVHIGDNLVSDYINPKNVNIDSILIKNAWNSYRNSLIRYCKKIDSYDKLGDRITKGLIFNKCLYNSPFSTKKNLFGYAYVFFGPLFFQFCVWLYNKTQENRINDIWFFAREGYYLKPLYDFFCEKMNKEKLSKNTRYVLTSRKAAAIADMDSLASIKDYLLNGDFVGTLDELLEIRFGISEKTNNETIYSLPRDFDSVISVLNLYKNTIYKNAYRQKSLYQSYINSIDQDYKNKHIGIVDIGYSGTAQYHLSNVLEKKFVGYYFALSNNVRPRKNNQKCYACFFKCKESQPDLNPWMLIEAVLTAPYGQFGGFQKDGSYIFATDDTNNVKENLDEFFYGIKLFFNDMYKLMTPEQIKKQNFSKGLALDLLKSFYWGNISVSKNIQRIFEVETAFNGGSKKFKVL